MNTADIWTPEQVAKFKDRYVDWPYTAPREPFAKLVESHEALRAQLAQAAQTINELHEIAVLEAQLRGKVVTELAEAQADVRASAEAIRSYFDRCPENYFSGQCGGEWPCLHVESPMRKTLGRSGVRRLMEEA
jgi:hypothetical protein